MSKEEASSEPVRESCYSAGMLALLLILLVLLVLGTATAQHRQGPGGRENPCLVGATDRSRAEVGRHRRVHRSRVAHGEGVASLDDRTWDDLNLDDVFAVLDRTEGTLGQHALYHRLRTAPVAEHLEAFEALVTRLGSDAPLRERTQTALARLQDPHGYDLWWLAKPDAIDVRPWYIVFPAVALATMTLVVAAVFVPQLLPAVVVAFVIDVCVRYLTDFRIAAVARAFRQLAPVIAAGQALQFLDGDDSSLSSARFDRTRLACGA